MVKEKGRQCENSFPIYRLINCGVPSSNMIILGVMAWTIARVTTTSATSVTRCPFLRGTVTHFHDFSGVPQNETLSHIVTGRHQCSNVSFKMQLTLQGCVEKALWSPPNHLNPNIGIVRKASAENRQGCFQRKLSSQYRCWDLQKVVRGVIGVLSPHTPVM